MSNTGTQFAERQVAEAILAYEQFKRKFPAGGPEPPPQAEFEAAVARAEAATQNWSNPAYRRARQAEQAAAAEAERAARPHPRVALREAHARRAEAQAEVERCRTAANRAREFAATAATKRAAAETALADREASLVARLTDTFRGLVGGQPADDEPRLGPLRATKAQAEAEAAVAQAAFEQLDTAFSTAEKALARAEAEVFRAVVAVLLMAADERAEEIKQAEADLHARRTDLDALARCLAEKERGTGQRVLSRFSQQVFEALHDGTGQPRVRPAQYAALDGWRVVLEDLTSDAAAHGDLAALPAPSE